MINTIIFYSLCILKRKEGRSVEVFKKSLVSYDIIIFHRYVFWILFFDKNINYIERLLLATLMALPIHQFEEYELPGGGDCY